MHALERLSVAHRLAVVTNGGGEMQRSRLRSSGLDRFFDLIVASTDLDSGKPEPAIFLHTLERLEVDASTTWHIGDSLPFDVGGAHNAGLTSVWLNRRGAARDGSHPEPHHEIASLLEIETLLEGRR